MALHPRSLAGATPPGPSVGAVPLGAAPSARSEPARPAAVAAGREKLGPIFWAAMLWLWFEFGRILTPPVLPLALSGALLMWWISQPKKVFTQRDAAWFIIIGACAFGVLFSENTFAAFEATKMFTILFLGMCLPLQTLSSTLARARAWVLGFVAIAAFVGFWAATHAGFGPAGTDGHDENYVAAIVGMGAALSYFAIFAERKWWLRMALIGSLVAYIGAVALAANPSRGGFLGLIVVALYGLSRSPRKMLGIAVLALGGLALLVFAGDAFWAEIGTTTDYSSGTGDVRLEIWKSGLRMWQAHPVLGVGAGNFRWVIGDYQSLEQLEKFGRNLGGSIVAHSMHVELLAELGSVGVIATAVLAGTTWRALGRLQLSPARLRSARTPQAMRTFSCYADAIRAAMLAVFVNGVFLSLFYYSHLWLLVAVGTGLAVAHRRERMRLGLPAARGAAPGRGTRGNRGAAASPRR